MFEISKSKYTCPMCRKAFKNIIMPELKSSKMIYLMRLINKLINDINQNILIYINTPIMARGLISYINKELENVETEFKCYIINKKNKYHTSSILICPIDNNYLCQNIKNISNIIILSNINNEYILDPCSLGYDYCHIGKEVNIYLFEPKI